MQRIIRAIFLVATLWAARGGAEEPVSFVRQIAPILREKCLTCHGAEKAKGEFRVDSFDLLQKPGSSKQPPLVSGAPERSHLYALLTTADEDDRMPQKDDALPVEQLALFSRWIREGTKFDGSDPKATLASLAAFADQSPAPEVYAAPVAITALAFTADGKGLAVSGYHEITIWDSASGELLRRITNVAQRTFGLAFDPDCTVLAAASGTPGRTGIAKLFDARTGAGIANLTATSDAMLAVAFNPDGTRLACGGTDHAIRVFDIPSGKPRLALEQHADWVTGLVFSPDGLTLVSASRDKTARVFDAKTGELDATYTGHTDAIFAAAFGVDGKHVFTGGRDRRLHVWEVKDGKRVSDVPVDGEIQRIGVSTNGVFVAADNVVLQYTAERKPELRRTFSGHADIVHALAIHERSGRLASGSYDGEVRVWNLEDGKLLKGFTAAPLRLTTK